MPNPDLTAFLLASATALAGVGLVVAAGRLLGERWGSRLAEFFAIGTLTFAALLIALTCTGDAPGVERFLLAVALGQFLAAYCAIAEFLPQALPTGRAAPYLRAAVILVCGFAVARTGLRIDSIKLPFVTQSAALGQAAPYVTAVWLLVFSSLFGRAATIPGVAQGVAATAAITFYAICRLRPDLTGSQGAFFAALLAGACLPQALFASVLDRRGSTAGGYAVGFYVGVASIAGLLKNTALLVAAVPLIIVGAPLFAVAYTYLADLRGGWRAVAVGSRRRHLHQILLDQGYAPGQVRKLIMAGTIYLCLLAILLVAIVEVTFVLKLILITAAVAAGLAVFYTLLRMMHRPALEHAADHPRSVTLMGIKLNPVTMDGALAEAERYIREARPHMIVTTDATGFMRAQDDPEFRQIVNQADLVTPDGAGVVLAARLMNIPVEARCSGCDMVAGLCRVAASLNRSVYLLGAAPGVADIAAQKLREQVPALQVAGTHDGYFTEEDEPALIQQIRAHHPAALFVALGIPRQEKWIRAHLEELNVPVCVGVGGSFDVISGLKQRAPAWMQRAGLEWVYRVAKEPWRIPRLVALPRIVLLTFHELLRPPDRPDE